MLKKTKLEKNSQEALTFKSESKLVKYQKVKVSYLNLFTIIFCFLFVKLAIGKTFPNCENLDQEIIHIDLTIGMDKILNQLNKCKVKTRLSLTGPLIVARDIAHAKILEYLEKNNDLPEYFKKYPVYYAGPAKKPENLPSGSFGPTTAGRMDSYVPKFQKFGGSMVMLAKGNRSQVVVDSCKEYGGFYLGSIGGVAANVAQNSIKKVSVLEYPELGMEAVWKIEVENFPAFMVIDNKGNDFFK